MYSVGGEKRWLFLLFPKKTEVINTYPDKTKPKESCRKVFWVVDFWNSSRMCLCSRLFGKMSVRMVDVLTMGHHELERGPSKELRSGK